MQKHEFHEIIALLPDRSKKRTREERIENNRKLRKKLEEVSIETVMSISLYTRECIAREICLSRLKHEEIAFVELFIVLRDVLYSELTEHQLNSFLEIIFKKISESIKSKTPEEIIQVLNIVAETRILRDTDFVNFISSLRNDWDIITSSPNLNQDFTKKFAEQLK